MNEVGGPVAGRGNAKRIQIERGFGSKGTWLATAVGFVLGAVCGGLIVALVTTPPEQLPVAAANSSTQPPSGQSSTTAVPAGTTPFPSNLPDCESTPAEQPQECQAPGFDVDPHIAEASRAVWIRGDGCKGSDVVIFVDLREVLRVSPTEDGTYFLAYELPGEVERGFHTLSAACGRTVKARLLLVDVTGVDYVTTTTVCSAVGRNVAICGEPGFAMFPPIAKVGSQIFIRGEGCDSQPSVIFTLNGAEIARAVPDTRGFFTGGTDLPVSLGPGTYTVLGNCGEITLSNVLTIESGGETVG